jgi:DNA-binding NarL/FixJ family response regulator
MTIRVVVVDDQPLVRAGLRMILQATEDIEVVGEAADGASAVELCAAVSPDVVIMDVRMPVMDGIQATHLLTAQPDGPKVLVITTFDVDAHVYGALRAGASGFLLKDAPEAQLLNAIRVVNEGASLFAASATRRIVEHFGSTPPGASDLVERAGLTHREVEVLTLLARGETNAEIAASLFITEATVKTHVARIMSKLDARSRTQAVVMAYESALVVPGQDQVPTTARGWNGHPSR